MANRYRVGIIGCGKRAALHVPGLLADERAEVVAVADIRRESAEVLAAQFPEPPTAYDDHQAMLAAERPDLVISCLWTHLHLPVFADCVAAGVKAVQSEKPVAATWGECLRMAELARSSGCLLTFSHQRRFCAGNLKVRELIAAGRIGPVERLELYSPRHLLDCGTHSIDQGLSFIGDPEALWAMGGVDLDNPFSYFDVAAEGSAFGIIQFANGVQADIKVAVPEQSLGSGVKVIGDQGFIAVAWEGQLIRAVRYDEPGWQPAWPEHEKQAEMRGMVTSLFDNLDDDEESDIDWRKALRATEIIFALYESARSHRRIELPITITDNPVHDLLSR